MATTYTRVETAKACPFCGGAAHLKREDRFPGNDIEDGKWAYYFVCRSCAANGPWHKTETAALRWWNERFEGGE